MRGRENESGDEANRKSPPTLTHTLPTSTPTHKVDPFYLFNPNSRLSFDQETRLNLSSKQLEEKQKELADQDGFSAPVKFPTECFFFTVHAAHITWVPLMRRYRDYLHEVRVMQRSTTEMEASKQREDVRLSVHLSVLICPSVCQSVC